jgi:hypothetical protein
LAIWLVYANTKNDRKEYTKNPSDSKGSDCTVIGLFGDDPNDFMAKCGVKWLHKNGVNALCMSPGKKNYSHVNYPMERIETAIRWLQRMACSGFFHPFL